MEKFVFIGIMDAHNWQMSTYLCLRTFAMQKTGFWTLKHPKKIDLSGMIQAWLIPLSSVMQCQPCLLYNISVLRVFTPEVKKKNAWDFFHCNLIWNNNFIILKMFTKHSPADYYKRIHIPSLTSIVGHCADTGNPEQEC